MVTLAKCLGFGLFYFNNTVNNHNHFFSFFNETKKNIPDNTFLFNTIVFIDGGNVGIVPVSRAELARSVSKLDGSDGNAIPKSVSLISMLRNDSGNGGNGPR